MWRVSENVYGEGIWREFGQLGLWQEDGGNGFGFGLLRG